jgi:hypothetical protein
MSNITVLEEIVEELEYLAGSVKDPLVKAAAQAKLIKYKKDLVDELQRNALDVIDYKIKHLTKKLK